MVAEGWRERRRGGRGRGGEEVEEVKGTGMEMEKKEELTEDEE